MNKYTVFVDSNSRSQDESARYKFGEFDTYEAAVSACKKIVDQFFQGHEAGKDSFEKLWENYTMFGEDPFITSGDKKLEYSAWDNAKELCRQLSSEYAGDRDRYI